MKPAGPADRIGRWGLARAVFDSRSPRRQRARSTYIALALHNGCMDSDREPTAHTPVWRDPLSAGWRAHRGLLLLRLRWHERRRETPTNDRRP